MTEIWMDIPGWENYYQASSWGRIRSLSHYARGGHGAEVQRIPGKILKPTVKKRKDTHVSYLVVSLCRDGKPRKFYVHRLVYATFMGPIPDDLVINHKDENPHNNHIDNLMVCTQAENLAWGTHNERMSKALKERAKIINPITHITSNVKNKHRAIRGVEAL